MVRESEPPNSRRASRIAGVASIVGVVVLLAMVPEAVFSVLAGILIAIFLSTVAGAIARHSPIPYGAALAALVLGGIGALLCAILYLGPQLVEQLSGLAQQLPRALHDVSEHARAWTAQRFGIAIDGFQHADGQSLIAGARGVVTALGAIAAGVIVAVFIGLYGAISPRAYVEAALKLVPPEKRGRAEEIFGEIGKRLGRWMIGRVASMTIVGVASAIALAALKVPLALSLGLLAGTFTFIEYIGAIASAIPPMVLALADEPIKAVWVLVLFTAIHVVDGYLLTPFIVRTAVRFSPAFTISAQALFGALFGVIGLTFASPFVIVCATIIEMLYVEDTIGQRQPAE